MDAFKPMAVFATVVHQGSMSRAAQRLGISTSAVSQTVRALEREHGVTLLHRSTRKLTLSDAGARVYAECAAMVEAAERAQAQLRAHREQPSGELRLAAPVGFSPYLTPALAPLLQSFPALSVRLLLDDALIDLIDARIDLAIRVGRLPDSNWIAQRICGMGLWLCAAPEYLERAGLPRAPEELRGHQWLAQGRGEDTDGALELSLRGPADAVHELRVQPRVRSNNQWLLQQMCLNGQGLALLRSADAWADLQQGRLQRVLPAWQIPVLDVWTLSMRRDVQPAKVRLAAAALADYLRLLPGMLA